MEGDSLATLPNFISLSRLGLAAAFVLVRDMQIRLLIVGAAGATDFLDGYLARVRRSTSRLGALIDPIADRFFVFTAVCALLFEGILEPWQYAILISRDFVTAVGFLASRAIPRLRGITFMARFPGKVVTVLQLAVLAFALLEPRWLTPGLVAVGAASAYSIADYTAAFWRARVRA